MQLKLRTILIHTLLVLCFLLIPYVFVRNSIFTFPDWVHNPHDQTISLVYLLILLFLYVHYYQIIPRLFLKEKYVAYVFCVVAALSLFLAIYLVEDSHGQPLHFHLFKMEGMHKGPPPFQPGRHEFGPRFHKPPPMMFMNQILFLYLIGIFTTLFLRLKNNLLILEKEKQEAELSHLKAQINPHFLFNTFNSIYALALREQASQTASGMLKLSGMMRYVVTESTHHRIALTTELEYIADYIELQKLRLDKSVRFEFGLEGSSFDKEIAPLLLIPFIENAFKHGVSPDEPSYIQ
ncbi:MAG TPA: histidine kinase, partial [Chitinophagaceae bacterium]|nr:histidine kinase [Chitinophagaceae bacterium]